MPMTDDCTDTNHHENKSLRPLVLGRSRLIQRSWIEKRKRENHIIMMGDEHQFDCGMYSKGCGLVENPFIGSCAPLSRAVLRCARSTHNRDRLNVGLPCLSNEGFRINQEAFVSICL